MGRVEYDYLTNVRSYEGFIAEVNKRDMERLYMFKFWYYSDSIWKTRNIVWAEKDLLNSRLASYRMQGMSVHIENVFNTYKW